MELEYSFHQKIEEWITHCRNPNVAIDSSSKSLKNCKAYREIVSMSHKALPLILQVYYGKFTDYLQYMVTNNAKENKIPLFTRENLKTLKELRKIESAFGSVRLGLVSVVKEIVGDKFSIPKEIRGKVFEMEEYTKKWIENNV